MLTELIVGGHFDLVVGKRHGLPWGEWNLADLPAYYPDATGNAHNQVLAPRLEITEVKDHSLILHAGGEKHAVHPDFLVAAVRASFVVLFGRSLKLAAVARSQTSGSGLSGYIKRVLNISSRSQTRCAYFSKPANGNGLLNRNP